MMELDYRLIDQLGDLKDYLDGAENELGHFALDTEATSLDTRKAKLVGLSLCFVPGTAIYVPVGHKIGRNLPKKSVMDLIDRKCENYVPVFFNAKYDLNVLQANTGWTPPTFEDALELVYLADPDRKKKGLKLVAKEDLNFNMEPFEDLFTPEEQKAKVFDISTKSPRRCADYGAKDADATLRAWIHFQWVIKEFGFAVKVDRSVIDEMRRVEHNGGMELNPEYVQEQLEALEGRGEELKALIHRIVGSQFEINSPKQLGIALFDTMGLPSQGMTRAVKNPIYRTDATTLERLAKSHPIAAYVIAYRKVDKARSSYFKKLRILTEDGIKPRFNFNLFSAPTFRFSAPGGDPKKDGATGINIQAVSNGEALDLTAVNLSAIEENQIQYHAPPEDLVVNIDLELGIDHKPEKDVKGGLWSMDRLEELPNTVRNEAGELMCFRETCAGCPPRCDLFRSVIRRENKGLLMVPSVRQAFRAPAGYKMVSFDYDRQEAVIGANMSGEPKWLNALKQGIDLHEQTAAICFGMFIEELRALPEPEYKRRRQVGKVINFSIFFGATAYSIAANADIPKAMAEQFYDGFVRGHPTLISWIKKCHIFSRKTGYTTTYFGRKRWLKQFYSMADPKMHAFADRSAVNTAVQGTGAEVTRIAIARLGNTWKREKIKNSEARLVMQLHDELSWIIRDELIFDMCQIIKPQMEFNVKNWAVQLTAAPKIGQVWGKQTDYKTMAELEATFH